MPPSTLNCAPYAARDTDWSIARMLSLLEQYNGLSYANAGRPSPYIWSGTDQYSIGKVVVDHGPIEPIVDKQLGCAGLYNDNDEPGQRHQTHQLARQ